ncbi:MAG: rhodanese-like domain-containing protein [Defluviitaleaceae bacterium]|nr:rhodanese-like domain-containing protein [Defluviitaleaceae bacterium]
MTRTNILGLCAAVAVLVSACAAPNRPGSEQADMEPTFRVIRSEEAIEMLAQDPSILLIDVRTAGEFGSVHAVGALNLPLPDLAATIGGHAEDYGHTIIIYCQTGRRSREGAQALIDAGYTSVFDAGGIVGWAGETVSP